MLGSEIGVILTISESLALKDFIDALLNLYVRERKKRLHDARLEHVYDQLWTIARKERDRDDS